MNLTEAEAFAARIHAAMNEAEGGGYLFTRSDFARLDLDRKRVTSDLDGLRVSLHLEREGVARDAHRDHAARYWTNLLRTGAMYGVTP